MKMKVQMELTLMAMVLVDNIHQGIWRTLRITQPIIKNSSSTSSKMVATKKKPNNNTFGMLCGASITGGVINLNIYSGNRKHFEYDSSQE